MAGPITTPVTTVKKPLWRRVLRWTLRGLAGVIVLLVLAIAFLHTSWGKDIVRGVVEKRLAAKVNGTVKIGSLDYGFMFSSLSIGGIEIKNAANQPALAIAKVDLVLERRALLRKEIILDDLTITGLDARSPEIKGLFRTSNSKPLAHVQVKRLSVTGKATITKPDGSVIAVDGLDLAGSVDARPAAQTLELALAKLAAKVDLPNRHIELAIDGVTVKKDHAVIDLAIAKLGAGAIALETVTAHIDRATQHALKIGKARIDNAELAKLLGKPVLVDDVAIELAVTGPESALALTGTVATRETKLVLSGKADLIAARPTYELDLTGHGKSVDLTLRPVPAVETDVKLHITGSGRPPLDHEATITLALGPTKVGKVNVDGVDAKILANRGAYTIEQFDVKAVGFAVAATGTVSKDKQVDAKVGITGNVTQAMTALAAAGVKVPPRVPKLGNVDLAITAKGALAGELVVDLAPTRLALAGGSIGIKGDATLDHKKLAIAHATITLGKLDLAALSRLAGRPPKANGTLSGTLALTKTPTSRDVTYAVDIALADKPLTVHASGTADLTTAKVRADISTRGSLLATVDAKLPLDAKGFTPRGAWTVKLDVAKRELASLAELLPGKQLPAGSVEVHAQLGGSLAKPTGTIEVLADLQTKQVALTAKLAPSTNHLAIATDGSISLAGDPLAAIKGTIDMPYRLTGKQPDVAALRAGLAVDATIDIPERTFASLASLRPKLATVPGTVGGKIVVKGAIKTPTIDARLAWRGYTTSSGKPGETLIAVTGTPAKLVAAIDHGALHITADVDRSNQQRMTVHAKLRAQAAPLADVIPSFVKMPPIELGKLDTDLSADIVLASAKLDALAITGKLDVKGAAITLPNTKRRYHDITLSLAGEPTGLAIETTLHETDLQKRRIDITGHLALDQAKPRKLDLALVSKDWLVFGGDKLGKPDAPRATASFDIAASVDFTQPVLGVDATVKSLTLLSPDRLERGHYFEKADVGGDILFVGGDVHAGKLPVVAAPVATKKRRPIDVRVHIPNAIHVEQTPLDLYASGELAITVRDAGIATRGQLTMERGKVNLFGKDHALTSGKVTFDDAHPKGELALEFARELPNVSKRDLARSAGTANITFTGPPTKPKVTLHGAASAAMVEVMAMYNAGRPVNIARPGEPTSPMATAPRGDQWLMLTFMASNLPHLLFLDRITTWGEHRITNVEAENYVGKTHVRAVVRPPAPGRSENELQIDRVLLDTDRAAIGVGVRGGDRLGGGLGVFFEWSSE